MLLCTKSPYPEKPLTPYSTLIPAPMPSLVCCLCAWPQPYPKAFGSQLGYICPAHLLSLIDFLLNLNMRKSMIGLLLALQAVLFINNKVSAQGVWYPLKNGLTCDLVNACTVYALCADTVNNVLYAGGLFSYADSTLQQGVAKWDGTKWDSIPDEGLTQVHALIMFHDSLYVGDWNGEVHRFDGNTWKALPSFNSGVSCLEIYQDTLYAGGAFTKSGNTVLNNIAKWDGTNWLPVKGGVTGGSFTEVNAMTIYNDTLIIGGLFSMADTIPAFSIAKWDGVSFSTVGTGITIWSGSFKRQPGYVNALEVFQGNLYVGGEYDSAGSKRAFSVASWNNNQWDTLTIPNLFLAADITAMRSFDGYLFMTSTGSENYISKYNNGLFLTVDSGINKLLYSLDIWNGSLYVGGEFDSAGKKILTNGIARWKPDSVSTDVQKLSVKNEQVTAYPNPTSNELNLNYAKSSVSEISILNLLGQTLIEKSFDAATQRQIVNVSTLPSGIYFYQIVNSDLETVEGKFVKE